MEQVAILLFVFAAALVVVGFLVRARRAPTELGAGAADAGDVISGRPPVAELHVVGEEARVTFDVPLPEGADEVLAELLVAEAVEVVREKRHSLPMSGVTAVVALAGRDEVKELGRAKLETPGHLPPATAIPGLLNLSHLALDPLDHQFEGPVGGLPGTVEHPRPDELGPVAAELRLPRAIETGLRAQGVDPEGMSAGDLVVGMLRLVGYQVEPGPAENTFLAHKGGVRTYIRQDTYRPGDHPEVEEGSIGRFMAEFATSGADRGLYVTEKFGPFEIYQREHREPRVRFVTRERLQKMVDSLSLG